MGNSPVYLKNPAALQSLQTGPRAFHCHMGREKSEPFARARAPFRRRRGEAMTRLVVGGGDATSVVRVRRTGGWD